MKASDIVTALRNAVPEIADRVAGAMSVPTIIDAGKMTLPALWVIQADDEVEITGTTGSLISTDVFERFTILLELSKTDEYTGYKPQDLVPYFRDMLMSTLNNRYFDDNGKLLYYFGGSQSDSTQSIYRWAFEFRRELFQKNYDVTDDLNSGITNLLQILVDYNLNNADESTYPNAEDTVNLPQ